MTKKCPKTGKQMFLRGEAINVAKMRSAYKRTAPGRAYECEHCGFWHVTKGTKR